MHGLKHLEILDLEFCQEITGEGLLGLAHTCKSLKRIVISQCKSIDEEAVKALRAKGLEVKFDEWTRPPFIHIGNDEDDEDEEDEEDEEAP